MSKITLINQASDPPAPAPGRVSLYSKASNKNLFIVDENGAVSSLVDKELDVSAIKATPGTLPVGSVVYMVGWDGGNQVITVDGARADSSSTMPGIGLVSEEVTDSGVGKVRFIGQLTSVDTSSFSVQDNLYISASAAGTLTDSRPTGSSDLIQTIGRVSLSSVTGVIEINHAGRSNSLPNLADGQIWVGDSNNHPVQSSPMLPSLAENFAWVGNAGSVATAAYAPFPVPGLIFIRQKSDFGTFTAGVCTLVSGAVYEILESVDLGTDRLEGNTVTIRGNGSFQATISTSSASALFTSNGDGFFVANGVSFQNNNGPLFNLTTGSTNLSAVSFTECFFTDQGGGSGGSFGTINESTTVTFNNCFLILMIDGIIINGSSATVSVDSTQFVSALGASAFRAIRFSATSSFDAATVINCPITTFNANDKGVSVDNSSTVALQVRVNSCIYNGLGEFIDSTGKDKTNPDVITITNNSGVDDSSFLGAMQYSGNGTNTTISSSGTPVPVGTGGGGAHAVFSLKAESERFQIVDIGVSGFAQDQRMEYQGKVQRKYRIDVEGELDKAGGGTITYALCVIKNGVEVPDSRTPVEVTGDASTLSLTAITTLATGDQLGVCVVNETNTTNVNVQQCRIIADAVS